MKISFPPTRLSPLTRTSRPKQRIEHNGKFSPLASGLHFINKESATTPSADFCPVTPCITAWSAPTTGGRKARQISPGKNMIFPCTTAAFTSPHVLRTGFEKLCSLAQGFGLICGFCPSARRFALRLLSDIGSPLSPCLRLVLFEVVRMTPSRKMYRGLSPHKIMPMPGTHKSFKIAGQKTALLGRRKRRGAV